MPVVGSSPLQSSIQNECIDRVSLETGLATLFNAARSDRSTTEHQGGRICIGLHQLLEGLLAAALGTAGKREPMALTR